MADDRMAALELLRKAADDGDLDFLKEGWRRWAQLVMDAEVSTQIGAPSRCCSSTLPDRARRCPPRCSLPADQVRREDDADALSRHELGLDRVEVRRFCPG